MIANMDEASPNIRIMVERIDDPSIDTFKSIAKNLIKGVIGLKLHCKLYRFLLGATVIKFGTDGNMLIKR